ncbi:thiamine-phosphate pyrophosphorylase [Mucilaginibacter yixingensis]|uniref:Thiamine-phosphate pyrophosphorylase n=1 Tax=Mucilaginibacter yixingensis TaxID=1295612 RepID=A0A2T5J9A8_9SPHI|nr:thiamine phosphate synthase [Mucilaginibacter yixingensis]PTQ96661.1 thiamine-phosphate pyrophosphorylase [Mucilaginibacter yixingensis]
MQLIVITDAEVIDGETAIINELFNAGLSRLHLRKPGGNAQQICALLNQVDAAFYSRIALHQHHELAQVYGIKRLHYTESARQQTTPALLQSLKSHGYTLSTSIHDLALADSLTAFDYAFFGPVFNSLSKPGYTSNLSPAFRLDRHSSKPELIGLGGITHGQLPAVKAMGFEGVAVLGAIWNEPGKALQTFEKLKTTINTL